MIIAPSFGCTIWILGRIQYCTDKSNLGPKTLFKYLMRQCQRLPENPRKYYQFMIKQSYKQHLNESEPERIKQIITRAYEDAHWVLKKYGL